MLLHCRTLTATDVKTGTENMSVNPLCHRCLPVYKLTISLVIFSGSSLIFSLIFMTHYEQIAVMLHIKQDFLLQLGTVVLTVRWLCDDSRGSIRSDETLMIPVGNQASAANTHRQYTSKKDRMQTTRQRKGCMQTSS